MLTQTTIVFFFLQFQRVYLLIIHVCSVYKKKMQNEFYLINQNHPGKKLDQLIHLQTQSAKKQKTAKRHRYVYQSDKDMSSQTQ